MFEATTVCATQKICMFSLSCLVGSETERSAHEGQVSRFFLMGAGHLDPEPPQLCPSLTVLGAVVVPKWGGNDQGGPVLELAKSLKANPYSGISHVNPCVLKSNTYFEILPSPSRRAIVR